MKLFPKINKNVIEAVAETKALLIYADNLYMYATINGEEISEDYPQNATSKKGILRKELAEELLSQVQRINFKPTDNFDNIAKEIVMELEGIKKLHEKKEEAKEESS